MLSAINASFPSSEPGLKVIVLGVDCADKLNTIKILNILIIMIFFS
jgi:hypothetical protein